jgi:hypothetical protein
MPGFGRHQQSARFMSAYRFRLMEDHRLSALRGVSFRA